MSMRFDVRSTRAPLMQHGAGVRPMQKAARSDKKYGPQGIMNRQLHIAVAIWQWHLTFLLWEGPQSTVMKGRRWA
jgi:hypothetical protein